MSTTVFEQTGRTLSAAGREIRAGWTLRTTLMVASLAAALIAPSVLPLSGRMPDLAAFVYLAVAAVGLAYAVGLAGIPSLGQGAFLGVGAFAEAIARAKGGWPLLPSLLLAVVVATAAGVLTGLATGRLRGAFVAASTWILSWVVALALDVVPRYLGRCPGPCPPRSETRSGWTLTPTAHYELGIVLLALAIVAFAVVARRRRASRSRLRASTRTPRSRSASPSRGCGSEHSRPRLRSPVSRERSRSSSRRSPTRRRTRLCSPSRFSSQSSSVVSRRRSAPSPGSCSSPRSRTQPSRWARCVGSRRAPRGDADGYGLLLVLGLGGAGLLPTARSWWGRRRGSSPERPSTRPRGTAHDRGRRPAARRTRALQALREPRRTRRSRPRRQTWRGARADRAERIGQDNRAEGAVGRAQAGFRLDRSRRRPARGGDPAGAGPARCRRHAADDCDLPRADGARAHPGRRRPPSPPLRPLSNALPDASGEGRGSRGGTAGPRSARAGRPAGGRAASPPPSSRRTSQRLLMLASALATQPRVLLLDEPAAGASSIELDRLVDLLKALRSKGLALLLIEHNLRFVRRVADEVTVLEAGRRIASGTLAEVAANDAVRVAYLGRQSFSYDAQSLAPAARTDRPLLPGGRVWWRRVEERR